MKIVTIKGKCYLLSDDGFILHSENTRSDIAMYTLENFASRIVSFDDSAVYLDERGFFVTESELELYYQNEEDHNELPHFSDYLRECCGKNGTLTRL